MSEHAPDRELPEPDDDQIRLLDSICKAASTSTKAPFKALIGEYYAQLKENGLDSSRDDAILRWIMRVGNGARRSYRIGMPTNFIPYLRNLLEAQGITVIDEDGEVESLTHSLGFHPDPHRPMKRQTNPKRRVSFDDAHLEETWLSERSRFADEPSPGSISQHLPRRPLHRDTDFAPSQRTRSASSGEGYIGGRQPAPKHFQDASPSSGYTSEAGDYRDPTLVYEHSQTGLELDAAGFRMSHLIELKFKRWKTSALDRCDRSYRAAEHDRLKLLREALIMLRDGLNARNQEMERINHLTRILTDHQSRRLLLERSRIFFHWYRSVAYNAAVDAASREKILTLKYFRLWRDIAAENAIKSRSIMARRYLALWRDRTARCLIVHETAYAHREEFIERKYLREWYRRHWNSRIEVRYNDKSKHKILCNLVSLHREHVVHEEQANSFRARCLARTTLQTLSRLSQRRKQDAVLAQNTHSHKVAAEYLRAIRIGAELAPIAASVSLKNEANLVRRAFRVWHLHLTLVHQASDVDRQRILQTAWTGWNDALRCKALGHRINERLLLDNFYRWINQSRLQSFRRAQSQALLRRLLQVWDERTKRSQTALDEANSRFADFQQRRRLKFGMLRLNIAIRTREDAERTAIEFSNSRALPDVISVWRQETGQVRKLARWAADARFYCLCTRTLNIWQQRTTEIRINRRRDAYVQVRTRTKIRIVRECMARWRSQSQQISTMNSEAGNLSQARLFKVGTAAFDTWRDKTTNYQEMIMRAGIVDQQKLLSSALGALVNQFADLAAMDQQSFLFRQRVDLDVQGSAFRKIQWATFTAARRVESADALGARNRDQHMKHMLRHWASQAAARKSAKSEQQDPESPSLRPASRLASRSVERSNFDSSPPVVLGMPAYMKTPLRSRRSGRFRPLPTPAHVTPMAFDSMYLVTTPAPQATSHSTHVIDPAEVALDVFDELTPQITSFNRKLRAGGVTPMPPSALRSSVFGRSMAGGAGGGGGTNKSVRFAGSSRFGSGARRDRFAPQG